MLDKVLYVVGQVICLCNYYNLFYRPSYRYLVSMYFDNFTESKGQNIGSGEVKI